MEYRVRQVIASVAVCSFTFMGNAIAGGHAGGAPATRSAPSSAVHWTYSGHGGPEHWGELDPKFKACKTGKQQSPVDLKWSRPTTSRELQFEYSASDMKIVDNGHTIQVNFDPGNSIVIEGTKYDLLQVHFHAESEHKIGSKSFPLEAHFVHKNAEGKLAVVGVMFKEGEEHPTLEKIFKNVPIEQGKEVKVSSVKIDPKTMMPSQTSHYHYMGSLTTPPCSEGVNWNVLNTPLEASREQLSRFRALYSNNARPVQPLHQRKPANY